MTSTIRTTRTAKHAKKRTPVHMVAMTDPLGDVHVVVPITAKWIDKAIRTLPEYGRRLSEEMDVWLIRPQMNELLTAAIESEAGHDGPWCDQCMLWLDNPDEDMCDHWDSVEELMTQLGFEFHEIGGSVASEGPPRETERTFNMPEFRVPEPLKKLFSDPNSATHQAAKEMARFGLKRAVAAMGVNVPSSVVDEMFDAFYASAFNVYEEVKPRGDSTMSPQAAATILECAWPCDHETLKKAHKKKVLETHPDRNGGSNEKFIKVMMAYETLCDAGGFKR